MSQQFCIASNLSAFDSEVNESLREGMRVIAGTSYAPTLCENLPTYCSVFLETHDQQILITADDIGSFMAEVQDYLDSGYWVVPGTIYIVNVGPDDIPPEKKIIVTLYTIFLG